MTSIAQIIPPNVGGPCISVSSGPAKIAEPWNPSPRGCVSWWGYDYIEWEKPREGRIERKGGLERERKRKTDLLA